MRMRLDLEDRRDAVADVDRAGILPRADEHRVSLGRQRAEVHLRGLVRTVLGPHRGVHRELVPVRLAPERRADHLELLVSKPELPRELVGNGVGHRPAPAITEESSDAKSACPPVGPTSGSTACSGCGMSPTTLPASFLIPAIPRRAPFGLCASETVPSGPQYRNTTRPASSRRSSSGSEATNCPSPCLIGIS